MNALIPKEEVSLTQRLTDASTSFFDNGDDGPEMCLVKCEDARLASALLDEAKRFIRGFASSAESGFIRQRAAQQWLRLLGERP